MGDRVGVVHSRGEVGMIMTYEDECEAEIERRTAPGTHAREEAAWALRAALNGRRPSLWIAFERALRLGDLALGLRREGVTREAGD